MSTYWLATIGKATEKPKENTDMSILAEQSEGESDNGEMDEDKDFCKALPETKCCLTKSDRLIEWNVKVLKELLQQILASRSDDVVYDNLENAESKLCRDETIPMDEFEEIVTLPKARGESNGCQGDPNLVEVPEEVVMQLKDYVTKVSKMYL